MPPTPSVQQRLAALEDAILTERARRLALLIAILGWVNDDETAAGFYALRAYLEERIQEEGP